MAMNLRLSDEDSEALRRQAEAEQRSMQAVAQNAIREYVQRRAHKVRVNSAIATVIAEESEVLRRLGEA
jgi:predicted transcriptional regulator